MDDGQEIPDELDVEVPEGGAEFYEAFWWCSGRRGYHGMSGTPMAIPGPEIETYARTHGLEVAETMYFVNRMDLEWLASMNKAAKAREPKRAPEPKAKRPPALETYD